MDLVTNDTRARVTHGHTPIRRTMRKTSVVRSSIADHQVDRRVAHPVRRISLPLPPATGTEVVLAAETVGVEAKGRAADRVAI